MRRRSIVDRGEVDAEPRSQRTIDGRLLGLVTSQITLPADAATPTTGTPAGLDWWNDYTEYGQPTTSTTTAPGSTSGIGYGWLGTKQRATTTLGYTLMGARLYNQTTALFTSLDPQRQGGDTAYAYPTDHGSGRTSVVAFAGEPLAVQCHRVGG